MIFHFKAKSVEQGQETGRSQGRGPHQGSALRRADFDGGAEHRNFLHGSVDHSESSWLTKISAMSAGEKPEPGLQLRGLSLDFVKISRVKCAIRPGGTKFLPL